MRLRTIGEVAQELGLAPDEWSPYGQSVAKVSPAVLERPRSLPGCGRLVLVSAVTPTPPGEGKTTTSIGLAQGLRQLGERAVLALREPSLGPCLGVKGGAVGGGAATVEPAERINLHFTGDFHAVTSANNLLAAATDNHLYWGNPLRIDPRRILWRRCIDMNDRALRRAVIGLGGRRDGVPREEGFDITAASEVMAILCLARDERDLRARLDRTMVGFSAAGAPVTARDLGVSGAMVALLHDALSPNLVQSVEGVPALVHGGPFANIAHGCSSLIGTRLALHLGDWAITEAGFAFDLGAEKFFHIVCRAAGLRTAAVVLVATVRALRYHGGAGGAADAADPARVRLGLPNLERHLESVACFGQQPIVALNRFASDSEAEIAVIRDRCAELGVPFAVSDHFARGAEGALELAQVVLECARRDPGPPRWLYELDAPLPEKISAVASRMYGAQRAVLTRSAERDLAELQRLGLDRLPICIAKTPRSLSDNPALRGRPEPFELTVRELRVNAGAGFVVVLTGDILRMPGLPRRPLAESLDWVDGRVSGLR